MAFTAGNSRLTSPTAEAIYDAAVDLFYEKGFEATSLRQIADVVGIKVGSLYNHIRSKEELLFNIMRSVMSTLIEQSASAAEGVGDPRERLRAYLATGIRFHAHHQRAAFVGNTELRALDPLHRRAIVELRDTYQGDLERHVRAALDAHPGARDRDVKLATYAAVALSSHVASWYRPGGELSLDDITEGLLDLYVPTRQTPTA
ncbi:TetR/AcrR family transcriptional regulator [Pseudonocardia halophobica]|uniref:TetR/AcrR family transcriptional regulator n=1 Tax=Pseudonocardia halophobica TaxID=29401 RepID=UPI003D92B575